MKKISKKNVCRISLLRNLSLIQNSGISYDLDMFRENKGQLLLIGLHILRLFLCFFISLKSGSESLSPKSLLLFNSCKRKAKSIIEIAAVLQYQ